MRQLFNVGDLLIAQDGKSTFEFAEGAHEVVSANPKEQIKTRHIETGALKESYPFGMILHFGIPEIGEFDAISAEPMLCPVCWGRGWGAVHHYYGKGRGEWKRRPCEVCDSKGSMPTHEALKWIRLEIAKREIHRQEREAERAATPTKKGKR